MGNANVLKPKFIHTLSESKNIFVLEQKAIALRFVKYVAFYWDIRYFMENSVRSVVQVHVIEFFVNESKIQHITDCVTKINGFLVLSI